MYKILFHTAVEKDLKVIDAKNIRHIKTAIEKKLSESPEVYGERLKHELKNYWKLRAGDYRVVFSITGREVWIFGIIHRREVYDAIVKRKR